MTRQLPPKNLVVYPPLVLWSRDRLLTGDKALMFKEGLYIGDGNGKGVFVSMKKGVLNVKDDTRIFRETEPE